MDNLVRRHYCCSMFGRVFALLAVLCFGVITSMTVAHAARMTLDDTQTAHAEHMMAAADNGDLSCDEMHHCGFADDDSCAAACAGLLSYIVPAQGEAFAARFTSTNDLPVEPVAIGRSPELTERPPQRRLL